MYKIFLGDPNEYAMFGLNKPETGPNPSALGSLETSLTSVELCFMLLSILSFQILEGY